MSVFVNPGNDRFRQALNSKIYVDKSGLISITNGRINSEQKYICVSRPRRFGKSLNLGMLAAYYVKGQNSHELFNDLEISKVKGYTEHLNKYNVIYLNMQDFLSISKNVEEMIEIITESLMIDFEDCFPDVKLYPRLGLVYNLKRIYESTKKNTVDKDNNTVTEYEPFIFLIDEWDCVMRENMDNKDAQKKYLDFIRNLLKDQTYVALAYMTGILPIKKYGSHSALNMFYEYSMLSSKSVERFTGFTAQEVKALCQQYDIDYEDMKAWYDGYNLNGTELYCPRSVIMAVTERDFSNYWTQTETYEALAKYITMNFDGLHETIEKLLAGQEQPVDTRTFSNDMVTFENKDDILTLLIHLGYLGYRSDKKTSYIPNKEIYDEYVTSMKAKGLWKETIDAVLKSKKLLADTLAGKADIVADCIRIVHEKNSSVLNYNNEQSLRFIVLIAYFYAREQYNIIQELPSGEGFADIVFIPKPFIDANAYPPMVVELKWNKTADAAIAQIKNKKYPDALEGYDNILLVGINYDKDSKEHECVIEKTDSKCYD